MRAIRWFPLWLISVACVGVGIISRFYYYDDPSENRSQGWHYYQTAVVDWYLVGLFAFWLQLFIWCFVSRPQTDYCWRTFIAGLLLSGLLFFAMALYCAPEYLFY